MYARIRAYSLSDVASVDAVEAGKTPIREIVQVFIVSFVLHWNFLTQSICLLLLQTVFSLTHFIVFVLEKMAASIHDTEEATSAAFQIIIDEKVN